MKNQYVADIGDYGKYSLLKAFINTGVSVGINWYLTEDDGTNDGKFTGYLDKDPKHSLRKYDPETFEILKQIRDSDRTICGVERSGLLKGASFYDKRMVFKGNAKERREQRTEWHYAAKEKLAGTSLVFLDPDNGLLREERHNRANEKYVSSDEIRSYYDDHNVVFYCHKGRRTSEEWERYKSIMPKLLASAKPIVLTYHKGTQRSYIFLVHPKDYEKYRAILDTFLKNWEGIFTEEPIKDPDINKYREFASKWVDKFRQSEEFSWIFECWEFVEDAEKAGCVMDAFRSYSEVFSTSRAVKGIKQLQYLLEEDKITAPLLGAMIFSHWRYYNHWADSNPEPWVRDWFIVALETLVNIGRKHE
ncbi:MAG: hypothetical protein IKG00_03770 [Lachnospiraceae bacterium]|nr:hypothetical protein [Lachnospiraceae bacterium]